MLTTTLTAALTTMVTTLIEDVAVREVQLAA